MGRLVVVILVGAVSGCAAIQQWMPPSKAESKPDAVAKEQRSAPPAEPMVKVTRPLKEDFVATLLEDFYTQSTDKSFDSANYLKLARDAYTAEKDEKTLVKYILASLLAGSAEDQAKAQESLKDVELGLRNVKSDESVLGLAALLQRLLSQQKDLQADLARTKQQVKDRDVQLTKLQEQINAIKSIEKNIHERRVGGTVEGR